MSGTDAISWKASSHRVNVALGAIPRILRDILEETISRQPDMQLVARRDVPGPTPHPDYRGADVVIVEEQAPSDRLSHERLLIENPRLRLLVLTAKGGEAHLLEFRRIPVSDVSPQGLLDAIRLAVNGERGR